MKLDELCLYPYEGGEFEVSDGCGNDVSRGYIEHLWFDHEQDGLRVDFRWFAELRMNAKESFWKYKMEYCYIR